MGNKAAAHDVGSNQYAKHKKWTERKSLNGKYSKTYRSSVDAKVPRFDDRTPDIGLLAERQRRRNSSFAPELTITNEAANAVQHSSRLSRIPLRRGSFA